MSFIIKAISFFVICTAIVEIIFQIASLARYPNNPMERVAAGIWIGASYLITGIVFWRAGSREKKNAVYNRWEVATALTSFLLSIVLIGVMANSIDSIMNDWACVYRFVPNDKCDVEKALNGVMLFGGVFAFILTGALTFISCYCYN